MVGPPRASVVRLAPVLFVLSGAALAQVDPPASAVRAAVERGVESLLARQELDGCWYYGDEPRIGCTALVTYALLESGVSPRHHAVQRAFAHLLAEGLPGGTYDAATSILAFAAHDARAHAARIQELADLLLEWQEEGGWGYPGGADLSNTQYAVLGLWAAARAGARVPERAWIEAVKAVLEYRTGDGGFGYGAGDGAPTGSMTAAGLGVLAICHGMLGFDLRARRAEGSRLVEAMEEARAWLGEHFAVTENPGGSGEHLGYYLYGLERAGALAGVERFGEHEWYAEASRFLVASQLEDGTWSSTLGGGLPETGFALLVLEKATAPSTGEHRALGGRSYAQGEDAGPVRIAASGANPIAMWVTGVRREARAALEWPGESGEGPRVSRVVWLVGGVEVARLPGDSSRPLGDERFAHRQTFHEPGVHEIVAQLHVLRPPRADPSGRTWPSSVAIEESAPLRVVVTDACPEWMLENARDRRRNLLPAASPTATASSGTDGAGPDLATDGRQATSWLALSSDPRPRLTIVLGAPVEADVVVVGHARSVPFEPRRWARALEVEVSVNGAEPHRLRMYPDERRKARLVLPRTTRVERLELVVPWRAPGEGGEQAVGLAEVELQLDG